jgi:mannose-6-phosphate isomerase-like protein (cupin superfamily)
MNQRFPEGASMFVQRVDDSPRNERGDGQVSHLLLGGGDFGSRNLSVTWVECAPGSQQELHAHRASEQAYVIVAGRGRMIGDEEERDVEPGMLVFIPPGEPHAIKNPGPERLIYVSATAPPFPLEQRSASEWVPSEASLPG